VLAGAQQPSRHGVLIDAEGRNNGLGRTAVAQQGQDAGHQIRSRTQPIEGRSLGSGEGLTTARTAIAPFCVAMHANVPPLFLYQMDIRAHIVADIGRE